MANKVKGFLKSEKGINTVEVVIILAIVVGLAILFRNEIKDFANKIIDSIFQDPSIEFSPGGMSN